MADATPEAVERNVGILYGNIFRMNERAYDAGRRERVVS
jgi:hypothetical protein